MFSTLLSLSFCVGRGLKNKSDVAMFCVKELFMFECTHSQVDIATECGVVSLILIFL